LHSNPRGYPRRMCLACMPLSIPDRRV
jgi:hypothetical protein